MDSINESEYIVASDGSLGSSLDKVVHNRAIVKANSNHDLIKGPN